MSRFPSQHLIFRWSFLFSCLLHTNALQLLERDILRAFFINCKGSEWVENTNWMNNASSVCEWSGVRCNEKDTEIRVEKLDLRNNNVTCTIPSGIFSLPHLRVLDLSGNNGVVAEFSNLDTESVGAVEKLFLADTSTKSLSGIDRVFQKSLVALSMTGNLLTGTFPEEIPRLTLLKQLDLSSNFLSGKIPDAIAALTDMQSFAIQNNMFSGQIPSAIGKQTALYSLSMQFNNFNGTVPSEFGSLSDLSLLCLNDQGSDGDGIEGPLPDFADLRSLYSINLANNLLTGTVPETLLSSIDTTFSFLMMIDLSGNQLSGVIPSALSKFASLRLHLFDNHIDGISAELCQQSGWFFGEVGEFGCDAILCPPGTSTLFGRQISLGFPCLPCANGGTEYFGNTKCVNSSTTGNIQDEEKDLVSAAKPRSKLQGNVEPLFSEANETTDGLTVEYTNENTGREPQHVDTFSRINSTSRSTAKLRGQSVIVSYQDSVDAGDKCGNIGFSFRRMLSILGPSFVVIGVIAAVSMKAKEQLRHGLRVHVSPSVEAK